MYDAIVVGAGFAGVCAARILAKRKFRVLLLEVITPAPDLLGLL